MRTLIVVVVLGLVGAGGASAQALYEDGKCDGEPLHFTPSPDDPKNSRETPFRGDVIKGFVTFNESSGTNDEPFSWGVRTAVGMTFSGSTAATAQAALPGLCQRLVDAHSWLQAHESLDPEARTQLDKLP